LPKSERDRELARRRTRKKKALKAKTKAEQAGKASG